MAYEIFKNTNSKKKKDDDDDIFRRVSEFTRQKSYANASKSGTSPASKHTPSGKTPTKPTVSSTVGNHTSDYGKYSGSKVGGGEEDPEKEKTAIRKVADFLGLEDVENFMTGLGLTKDNLTKANQYYDPKYEADQQAIAKQAAADRENAGALGKGTLGNTIMTGVTGISSSFANAVDFLMPTEFLGKYDPFSYLSDDTNRYHDYWDARRAASLEGKGKAANLASEFGVAVVEAIPTVIEAIVTGGGSLADDGARLIDDAARLAKPYVTKAGKWLGETLDSTKAVVGNMLKNPQYYMAASRTLGNDYKEAKANGASDAQAAISAIITTGLNAGLEVSGGIETLPKALKNADGHAVLKWVMSMPQEGIEEVLQRFTSGTIAKTIYDHDKEIFSKTNEDAIIHPASMGKEFLMGTAVGGLLGGAQVGAYSAYNSAVNNRLGKIGADYADVKDDLIAEGLSFGKGYTAYNVAEELQTKAEVGEEISSADLGRLVSAIEQSKRTVARHGADPVPIAYAPVDTSVDTATEAPVQSRMQTIETRLAEGGMDAEQASVVAQSLDRILAGDVTVTGRDKDVLSVGNTAARAIFEAETGTKLPSSNASTRKTISDYIAQTAMKQQAQEPAKQETAKPNVMEAWQNQQAQEETARQLKDNLFANPVANAASETLRQAAHQAVVTAQSKTDMNTLGEHGKDAYQKHMANAENAITFSHAFQRYYDAGQIGIDFEKIKTAYDGNIPRTVLYDAYAAGCNDVSAVNEGKPSSQNKNAQKGKNSPSKGKGRFYDNRSMEGKASSNGKTVTKEITKTLELFAKVFRVDIELKDTISDNDGNSIANGYYKDGKVVLAADSDNPLMTVLKHEVTHHIQRVSPAQYKAFKDYVMKAYYNNDQEEMNAEIQRRLDLARLNNVKLTREGAMDEIVADATEKFLTDRDAIEALVRENRSLGETILNAIRDVLRKIEAAMKGESLRGYSDFMDTDQLKQAEKMWVEALMSASMEDNVGIQFDGESKSAAPIWSLKTWSESEYVKSREEAAKMMAKQLGITKEKALAYIDDINGIARLIADDRVRLDYDSNLDENATVLKPNSDYKWSVDMSTLCAKRLLFTGTFDAIQRRMPHTVFDSDDLVRLRKMMMDKNLEVACGICYVESTRREIGRITQDFIDRYKEAQKTGKPITRLNSEGKVVELKKTKDQMAATADKSTDKFYADKDYTPTLAELNTTDIDMVKRDHPLVYEAYLNFMNARGQAKPKLLETRAEYKGEILKHFKAKSAVKARNDHGGLRLQSFSDFEVPHMIDMMQVIMDMSRVGLQSQAYTKVPAFAEVFGGTGVKINLSLIAKGDGLDPKGNLIFDDVEGMNHKEAFRLREQYSDNVGTILVGKNDAHIIAAMADPRIDFIIPFHKSSWKESLYDALGLTGYADYTDTQNEKPIDKDRKISNFDPSEYWDFSKTGDENAQIYLEKCREDGRVPKFPQFQGYPGYWKLLTDFKMYNNDGVGSPQTVVRPDFNMDAATKILNDYEGGHRSFPVAKDVVNEFVSEYKAQKNTTEDGGQFDLKDEDYTTYQIDWAIDNGIISKKDKAVLIRAIDNEIYRGYPIPKDKNGNYIVESGNVIMFTDGVHHNPSLDMVVVLDDEYETLMVDAKEEIYRGAIRGDVQGAAKVVEGLYWSGYATVHVAESYRTNGKNVGGGKRGVRKGTSPATGTRGNRLTLTDRIYLEAVEKGDLETAQRMVDEKAVELGYTIFAYHGSRHIFNVFSKDKRGSNTRTKTSKKWFFAGDRETANSYYPYGVMKELARQNPKIWKDSDAENMKQKGKLYSLYLKMENPLIVDVAGYDYAAHREKADAFMEYVEQAERDRNDGIILLHVRDNQLRPSAEESTVYMFQESVQAKLADPVTYDDDGNVIPLSERFNAEKDDIRYSLKDSDGKTLSKGQQEYFKDSKVRDENGNLMVMYHGTNTPNFTVFDPSFSDDGISLFFTNSPNVADSYTVVQHGGKNIDPYRLPHTIKTMEAYNQYMEDIRSETRIVHVTDEAIAQARRDLEELIRKDKRNEYLANRVDELEKIKGKYIHHNGGMNYITRSDSVYDTAEELIAADTNDKYWTPHRFGNRYAVYLKMTKPYVLDTGKTHKGVGELEIKIGFETTKARFTINGEDFVVDRGYTESYEDFARRFLSEKDADKFLRKIDEMREKFIRKEMEIDGETREEVIAFWEKHGGVEVEPFTYKVKNASIDYTEAGVWKNLEWEGRTGTTRELAKWAKDNKYDGVILKNLKDIGGFSGGTVTEAATVAIVFDSNQVKSTDNLNPTSDPDMRYQLKTPPELLEISKQIAEEQHKAQAVTTADIMSKAIKELNLTGVERDIVKNYQDAMKKLADYEKELAVYDATKGEHPKGRSIYTDASGKVKKSGVKYSAAEKADIQQKVNWWRNRLKEIERKEAFQKVLKREKAKMAETHAKKLSDLREAYNKRIDALRSQRDDKVEAEKQKMRDYKQHQRDSKAYKELKAKLEKDVKWLGDRLVHPTDAKHIPEDFKKVVATFLESLDFTTKGMDKNIAKTGKPSKKYINMWSMIEAYQKIAQDDSSNIVLTPIEEEMLKSLKASFENGRRVEDLDYNELNMVYDIIRWIKAGVATSNNAFNENIKESISEMGDATTKELRGKKAKKEYAGLVAEADKLLGFDNITPADMFHRFGGTLEKLYGEIRNGFNRHIENTRTAIHEVGKITAGHEQDIKKWSGKKAKAEKFSISDGTAIELTPAQVMSLYVLMKREQAVGHVLGSGIVPSDVVVSESKKVGKGNITLNTTKKITAERASQVTIEDIAKIVETLNEDQKRIADSIVHLFTTKCADWGNETSMKLYGYKKFVEKNYFPIKSSDAYLNARFDDGGDVLIKNLGMTKNTVVNANNPIVVEDIFDVLTDHVNKMSMYNALVVPLTDFTRVYNSKTRDADGNIADSVQKALEAAHGKQALAYVTQFMKDVNKQANTLAAESLANKALTTFKKAKVGTNLRVLAQQPTSIVRAAAMVDPKYLVKGIAQKANYEELFENSEIAYWKHLGFFETDTARSMKDILLDNENWLDKATMDMYGRFDDMAWMALWNAVKLEQADAHPDVDTTSSEFMDLVKARFEEVVDRTQVVDSVFHRSQLMRSKSVFSKMLTAFMSEPTKTYNMLVTDLTDAHKTGDKKKAGRTIGTFVASAIATSMASALIDALRDDEDEDKEGNKRGGFRKYVEAVGGNILDNINPANLVPYVKDTVSLFSGYDVKRTDMDMLSNFVNVAKKWTSGKHSFPYLIKETAASISEMFGIPVRNALRDLDAIVGSTANLFGGLGYVDYWKTKAKYDISNPDNRSKFYKHYTDALLAGDQKAADKILMDMVVNGIPYDNIVQRGYQKEKEVAAKEAKKLLADGKDDEARDIIRSLAKRYGKKYSTLWKSVRSDASADEVPEETYDFGDLQKAVRKGKDTDDIEEYLVESGEFSKEAMKEAVKMLTEKYR